MLTKNNRAYDSMVVVPPYHTLLFIIWKPYPINLTSELDSFKLLCCLLGMLGLSS